jgi:hypothetical protein
VTPDRGQGAVAWVTDFGDGPTLDDDEEQQLTEELIMSSWNWEYTKDPPTWEGTHPMSGAIVTVRECGGDDGEEWGYGFGIANGRVDTAVLADVLYANAEAAMQAAEALFNKDGELIDPEGVFRNAFGAKLRMTAALDTLPTSPAAERLAEKERRKVEEEERRGEDRPGEDE